MLMVEPLSQFTFPETNYAIPVDAIDNRDRPTYYKFNYKLLKHDPESINTHHKLGYKYRACLCES